MDQLENRTYSIRLKHEYEKVMKLNHHRNKLFTICAAPGESVPNVSKYDLTYHGETWLKVNGQIVRRRDVKVRISLFRDFPYSAPHADMISDGVPYHTNWWFDGRYVCNGGAWTTTSHIDEYVRFVIEVLQFKPERINILSAANHDAKDWWLEHQHDPSYFPTDSSPWPGERVVPRIKIM